LPKRTLAADLNARFGLHATRLLSGSPSIAGSADHPFGAVHAIPVRCRAPRRHVRAASRNREWRDPKKNSRFPGRCLPRRRAIFCQGARTPSKPMAVEHVGWRDLVPPTSVIATFNGWPPNDTAEGFIPQSLGVALTAMRSPDPPRRSASLRTD
jgi:hypothetical protein